MNTSLALNSEIKIHPSCMVKEIIEILEPYNKKIIVDATFGTGGHSLEIVKNTKGKLIAFEVDPFLYERGKKILKEFENAKIFNKSYTEIPSVLKEENVEKIDGILFDFGISFYHISSSQRGFSFKKNEILDMRYNPLINEPLYKKIKKLNLKNIEYILKNYGELKNYKKVALNIFKNLKEKEIKFTEEFNEIVLKKIKGNREKILQKVYQAFRIWLNNEIKNIETVFSFLPQIIDKKGKLIFLTYHSIEDRLVKKFLKNKEFKILTKKPLLPNEEEIRLKPNCSSCKLRAAEKI
ncbi:MAG: 16S rRNA (cytosine(1402)-N(4))-methyltransferase RsmH [Candidatus Hydrothermales bacterium]